MALTSLTRKHGVKTCTGSLHSVEEVALAVGAVIGHTSVKSAARMSGAVVLFVERVDQVNTLVETGISINGVFEPVMPLSQPATKITLSNVPPFISDGFLIRELSKHGKVVSPVRKVLSGCKSPLLKHIVSHRRQVFMILYNKGEDFNSVFKVRVDDYDYVLFATSATFKCFGCGADGHLVKACPDRAVSAPGGVTAAAAGGVADAQSEQSADRPVPVARRAPLVGRPPMDLPASVEPVEEEPQQAGEPGESAVSGEGVSGDGVVEGQVSQDAEGVLSTEADVSVEGIVSVGVTEVMDELGVGGEASDGAAACVEEGGPEPSECCGPNVGRSGVGAVAMCVGGGADEVEARGSEQSGVSLKRRKRSSASADVSVKASRLVATEGAEGAAASEGSDSEGCGSDCSVLSQGSSLLSAGQDMKLYPAQMFKLFLQQTKGFKKLNIPSYFPDLKVF
ncbi:uncharacterized protein LOC118598465, partial [Oryzias melastigma]|uniref:uncharacterized protein LOC118598465 n=1 Tax=Oryzias melastigma TaxID=30732 RepID=UPI00168D05E9